MKGGSRGYQLEGRGRNHPLTGIPCGDRISVLSHRKYPEYRRLENVVPGDEFYVPLGLALDGLLPGSRRDLGRCDKP